ncbi:MAG: hypothetical protein GKR94_27260 [Gammaproteobacteria bacterium]|nr:hypothetical protein [Gammaproteobacteria bacterium]
MQRLLAFAVLIAVIAGGVAAAGIPLWTRFQQRSEAIDDKQLRLSKLHRTMLRRSDYQRELAVYKKERANYPGLLRETRPALAVAALQARIKQSIQRAKGRLRSANPLKPKTEHGFHLISIDVSAQLINNGMQTLLRALEGENPRLVIELLTIDAQRQARGRRLNTQEPRLNVRFIVRGVVAASE